MSLDYREAEIREKITALQIELAEEQSLSVAQKLAVTLHEKLCGSNHIDGCSWMYEIRDGKHVWDGVYSAHKHWLTIAERFLEVTHSDVDMVLALIPLIREAR